MPALPASAQVIRAGVVTTVQGTATVARQSTPQPLPLKFKDDLFVQDRVTTGEQSLARILLGGKAVVTVREHSALTITERPGAATGPAVPRVVRETTTASPRVDGDDIRPRVVPPVTPTAAAPPPDDNGGEHCGNGHAGHHGTGHDNRGSLSNRRRGDQTGDRSPGRSRAPRPAAAVTTAK